MLSPVEELRMPSDEWIKALADGRRVKFTYQELPDEGMRGRSSPLRLKVTKWSIRSY
jgi:hypothetical protein